jgi:hypothetical protein
MIIASGEPAGSLGHQLRSEGAVVVPRHRQLDVADLAGDYFGVVPLRGLGAALGLFV